VKQSQIIRSVTTGDILAVTLMAVPCAVFLYLAIHFCLNIPYIDDFIVILKPIRRAVSIDKWWTFRHYMLAKNQGHIPLITHLVAWIEVKYFGAINFR